MDLLIQGFSSPQFPCVMDLGIEKGIITYLAEHSLLPPEAKQIIAANGNILLPGLVESHIHLDKALLLDQMKSEASTLQEAISETYKLKSGYTKQDMRERAIRIIRSSIAAGVTVMRCQVELDSILEFKAMELMLELKEELRDQIDLQLVAFPQEGIFRQPGTDALMIQSLIRGADVVGGITYNDSDLNEHLHFIFGLADKYNKPIDLHVDFSDDSDQLAILDVIRLTKEYRFQGKVSVGHLTSLGSVKPMQAEKIAESIAKAGIHVMSLPSTELYLNGRADGYRNRRGLTPVPMLLDSGVNVIYGTNNIQNAFTPFGTSDPLDIGLLLAQTCYMGSAKDAEIIIDMATYRGAKALGISNYGLHIGADADLVLCNAKDVRTLLYYRSERLFVWKKGKQVASTSKETIFY